MYRSYISIPGNRAVRVTYEDERLLDDEGKLCLNASAGNNTLKEGIDDNLVELNTTVKYKDDATKTVYGSNNTMSLKDINGQNFTVIGSLGTTIRSYWKQLFSRSRGSFRVRW